MQDTDTDRIAQSLEDGSYYRAGRRWYSLLFHVPITERSYYLFVIFLALVNGYFAFESFVAVFPLKPIVPFITTSGDVWEEQPHILRITSNAKEDKNVAVMKYLMKSYVINRESYDLKQYELNYKNIWSQSTPEVQQGYLQLMDASNPYSPYRLYSNRARRLIDVLSVDYTVSPQGGPPHAEVVFEARVIADDEQIGDTTKWKAKLTCRYTPFEVDQSVVEKNPVVQLVSSLGVFGLTKNKTRASDDKRKVIPMTFIVSDYSVKELLE